MVTISHWNGKLVIIKSAAVQNHHENLFQLKSPQIRYMQLERYIQWNNIYHFDKRMQTLLSVDPNGNNFMVLCVVLIELVFSIMFYICIFDDELGKSFICNGSYCNKPINDKCMAMYTYLISTSQTILWTLSKIASSKKL